MVHANGMRVFGSDQAVTADWPLDPRDFLDETGEEKEGESGDNPDIDHLLSTVSFQKEILKALKADNPDITDGIYRDAILLLETGKYQLLRRKLAESKSDQYALFVGPHGNEAVDRIYDLVIEPNLQTNHFYVERAGEIAQGGPVNEAITNAIIKAKLIVVDLTGERSASYYVTGLAHALGKPVIILAQTGTSRHFDIAGYKWHFWNSAEDLEPKFEKILLGTLIESGFVS